MDTAYVKVWDPAVRIFHWSLAVGFFAAYFTEDLVGIHAWLGYSVLALVFFRIIWGFLGTQHARFTDFLYSPRAIAAYLRDLLFLRSPRYLGHTPAGGAMVIAMLISLLLLCATGLMVYGAEQQAGPLAGMFATKGEVWAEQVEEVHEVLANLFLALVALHVAAVLLTSALHRESLARAMVTGLKRRE